MVDLTFEAKPLSNKRLRRQIRSVAQLRAATDGPSLGAVNLELSRDKLVVNMCGIVAMLSGGAPISLERLQVSTRRLHHRGPDGTRDWVGSAQRVGLGHARLSIIDLITGDQPIANEDESVRTVVNGEF